jgi:hypothetical protein
VVVDARNVLRSRWPNIPERELVDLAREWAERNGLDVLLVFDGNAPERGDDGGGTPPDARARTTGSPARRSCTRRTGSSPPTASCGAARAEGPSA